MVCSSIPRNVVVTNIRKKKKNNDTGANKLICPARGPGCSFSGMVVPISKPERRLVYFHARFQPSGVRCFSVGESVCGGKSTSRKFVFIVKTKSRTCETSSPNL